MRLRPMPPFFYIRMSKNEQAASQEKTGIFYNPVNTGMTRNLEYGEVIAIGARAHEYFPEVEIGHSLIVHHFVQGEGGKDENGKEKDNSDHFIHEDAEYRYYTVTAYECLGRRNETYGVWDGTRIIPNKDFVFLKPAESVGSDINLSELATEIGFKPSVPMTTSEGGLVLFKEWTDSADDLTRKANALTDEVKQLAKSTMTPEIEAAIEEKQKQAARHTANITKRRFITRKVAHYNADLLSAHFKSIKEVTDSDNIIVLNIAANTETTFMGVTYNIIQTKYVAGIEKSAPKGTPINEKVFLVY